MLNGSFLFCLDFIILFSFITAFTAVHKEINITIKLVKKYSFKWNEAERLLYLTCYTIEVHQN